MSQDIWKQVGSNYFSQFLETAYRIFDSSYYSSSLRKRVKSDEDVKNLKRILDNAIEAEYNEQDAEWVVNNALYAPFKPPILKRPSRFGTIHESGIWYGGLSVESMLAERAYYIINFFRATEYKTKLFHNTYVSYQVTVDTREGVDLTKGAFAKLRNEISHGAKFKKPQSIGKKIREDEASAFKYFSARSQENGKNIGVFKPSALMPNSVSNVTFWPALQSENEVIFDQVSPESSYSFKNEQFFVNGVFPSPVE